MGSLIKVRFLTYTCAAGMAICLAAIIFAVPAFRSDHNRDTNGPTAAAIERGLPLLQIEPAQRDVDVHDEVGTIRHRFSVINNSVDQAVRIKRIVADCGCTSASLSKEIIGPSETAILSVDYNVRGIIGRLPRRSVTLFTDHPLQPTVQCLVGGTRQPRYTLSPSIIDFGTFDNTSDLGREMTVTLHGAEADGVALAVDRALVDDSWVDLEVLGQAPTENGDTDYELKITAREPPKGQLRSQVTIPISGIQGLSVTIPVVAEVPDLVMLHPARAFFGVIERGGKRLEHIEIRPSGPADEQDTVIKVTDVRHAVPGLEVSVYDKEKPYELLLSYSPPTNASGATSDLITGLMFLDRCGR